jgi:hypothetical protein
MQLKDTKDEGKRGITLNTSEYGRDELFRSQSEEENSETVSSRSDTPLQFGDRCPSRQQVVLHELLWWGLGLGGSPFGLGKILRASRCATFSAQR